MNRLQAVQHLTAPLPALALTSDVPQWFAFQTRSRHERRAVAELQKKHICAFTPMMREVHQWTDRRKAVDVPLFSCYGFVRAVLTPEVHLSVLKTFGVVRIIGWHGQPSPIPDCEIDAVQAVLATDLPVTSCGFLRLGERVRIRGGSLDGIEGVLIACEGQRKLVLSINLIQQSIAVTIRGYDIEPV